MHEGGNEILQGVHRQLPDAVRRRTGHIPVQVSLGDSDERQTVLHQDRGWRAHLLKGGIQDQL